MFQINKRLLLSLRSHWIPNSVRVFFMRQLGCGLAKTATISSDVYTGSNKIIMGENSHVNVGCFLDGSDYIILEDWVRLGPYVKIITGTHAYAKNEIRRGEGSKDLSMPVKIKKGSWIGLGVIIMPGVTIGRGCVIAAGSVVTKSTEDNFLYAGIPAKPIKPLAVGSPPTSE